MIKMFLAPAFFLLSVVPGTVTASGAATDPAADRTQEIVVEGSKEQRRTIGRYIAKAVEDGPENQYARFDEPVCPSVIGFSEAVETFIEQRIRNVADAAGIKVGNPDCDANFHLMIVQDGPEALASLRRSHSQVFGYMTPYRRQALSERKAPVYAWHVVRTVSVDNGADRSVRRSALAGGYGLLTDDNANAARTTVNSLILLPVRQEIGHAFVLIESDAVIGLSPVQIADFAAMRGLMRIREGAEEHLRESSILGLFRHPAAREQAPDSIDAWDLAILKALYAGPDNRSAVRQRAVMARLADQELVEAR